MEMNFSAKPPVVAPVVKQPSPPLGTISARTESTPSLAQFAINQMLNKGKSPPSSPNLNGLEDNVEKTPKPVGVFKDPDTGVFVTMLLDPRSGKVNQYPTEKALELYAWISKQGQPAVHNEAPRLNIQT